MAEVTPNENQLAALQAWLQRTPTTDDAGREIAKPRLISDNSIESVPAISTGAMSLDLALGIGGVPRGRVVEMFGKESGGKTTLALSICRQAQLAGGVVAIVDAEHSLAPDRLVAVGLDPERVVIQQPDAGEEALDMVESMAKSEAFDVVVVDSVAALTPRAELEGTNDDQSVGLQARMMSKGLRRLSSIGNTTDTALIFINQLREKIGGYGNPEDTPGGRALKFYSSLRLKVHSGANADKIPNAERPEGQHCHVTVIKNKVGMPHRKASFTMWYATGVDEVSSLVDAGLEAGVLVKRGAWIYDGQNGDQIGQGRNKAVQALHDDAELADELRQRILYAVWGDPDEEADDGDAPETAEA